MEMFCHVIKDFTVNIILLNKSISLKETPGTRNVWMIVYIWENHSSLIITVHVNVLSDGCDCCSSLPKDSKQIQWINSEC